MAKTPEERRAYERERSRRYYRENREKCVEKARKWREANPEKVREANRKHEKKRAGWWRWRDPERFLDTQLKYKYGITLAERRRMQVEQAGKCAICGKETKLYVDHDHISGKVRKLLCRACNSAIGFFEEDVEVMSTAISYLQQFAEANCAPKQS